MAYPGPRTFFIEIGSKVLSVSMRGPPTQSAFELFSNKQCNHMLEFLFSLVFFVYFKVVPI